VGHDNYAGCTGKERDGCGLFHFIGLIFHCIRVEQKKIKRIFTSLAEILSELKAKTILQPLSVGLDLPTLMNYI
jgi:hypothetical protein